jgi:hypothetical protein
MTDFVNLMIKSVQSFRGVHKSRVYLYIIIGLNALTYIKICVYNVFLNKKCAETFFLLSRAEQLLFFGSCTVQIPCALHEPANCNTMSRIQQAGTTGCSLALSIFSSLLPTSHLATFDIFLSRLRSHVKRSPPPSASSSFAVFYHLRYASLLPSRIRFHSNAAAAPHTSRSLPPAPFFYSTPRRIPPLSMPFS